MLVGFGVHNLKVREADTLQARTAKRVLLGTKKTLNPKPLNPKPLLAKQLQRNALNPESLRPSNP